MPLKHVIVHKQHPVPQIIPGFIHFIHSEKFYKCGRTALESKNTKNHGRITKPAKERRQGKANWQVPRFGVESA